MRMSFLSSANCSIWLAPCTHTPQWEGEPAGERGEEVKVQAEVMRVERREESGGGGGEEWCW